MFGILGAMLVTLTMLPVLTVAVLNFQQRAMQQGDADSHHSLS